MGAWGCHSHWMHRRGWTNGCAREQSLALGLYKETAPLAVDRCVPTVGALQRAPVKLCSRTLGKKARGCFLVAALLAMSCGRIGYDNGGAQPDAGSDMNGLDAVADALGDLGDGATTDPVDAGDAGPVVPGIVVSPTAGLATSESGGTDTFSIVLTSPPSADVMIALFANPRAEVSVLPASLLFTPTNWEAPQTVTLTGVDDAVADGDAEFTILLAPAASSDPLYSGRDADDVEGINRDNESSGIVVDASPDLQTSESGRSATFTVSLQAVPSSDVIVPVASTDTTEGTLPATPCTFTPLNWNVPQMVTVTGVDDVDLDGDQAYRILIGPASSSDTTYNLHRGADVSITNIDDDAPGFTPSPRFGLATNEGGSTAVFTLSLNQAPTADVHFAIASEDSTEGTVLPTTATFTSSNWNVPQTFTITGVDDSVADGDIPYEISLHVSASSDGRYAALADRRVMVTNDDDESPGITLSPTAGSVTTEAGGTATLMVRLDSQPTTDVTLSITSDTLSEGTVAPVSLTFTSTNWDIAQSMIATGVDDAVADGPRVYNIHAAVSATTDPNYVGRSASDAVVTNLDDDSAGILVAPTSGLATTESGGTDTFSIRLSSAPLANVSVALSSSDATEGAIAPGSVIFTTANWNVPQVITISGVNDSGVDGDIAYQIVTAAATSTDSSYSGMNASDVSVINQDNDSAAIIVMPTSGLAPVEGGIAASYSVVLNSQPTATVTLGVSSSSTEGSVSTGGLAFTTSNWNIAQTVDVYASNDSVDDGDLPFTIVNAPAASSDVNYSGLDAADVSATAVDNDAVGFNLAPTPWVQTDENGAFAMAWITATTTSTATINVVVDTDDATEGVVVHPTGFSGAAGNINIPIEVQGVDDLSVDGDQIFHVRYTVSSVDPAWNGLVFLSSPIVNVDNDAGNIIFSPASGSTVTDQGGVAVISAVLGTAPSANVTIPLSVSDATELNISVPSLTFTSANWNVPQTVTLTGLADGIVDGDQAVQLITDAAVSADAAFNSVNVANVDVVAIDSETGRVIDVDPTYRVNTGVPPGSYMEPAPHNTVSSDGRFVAFDSASNSLVPGDTNAVSDAFVRDRPSAATTRLSVTNGGAQARGSGATISDDARYLAFTSDSSSVVAGDTNSAADTFVRDRLMSTTTRASLGNAGVQLNGASYGGAISATGRFVVFCSEATNAVAGDTNGATDLFVHDRMSGTTVRANLTSAGAEASGPCPHGGVSADGRFVTFSTDYPYTPEDTNGATDVYQRDLTMGTTTLVSISLSGTAANAYVGAFDVSSDGRYVAFSTSASNITVTDGNGWSDVFVRDTILNTTTLVSLADDESIGNWDSMLPAISADGQRVAFLSQSTNMVVGDTNRITDVFVRDRATGTTTLISRSQSGELANNYCFSPLHMSGDGHTVVFQTWASNIMYPTYDPGQNFNFFAVSVP